jgi:hypothetical protein
VHPNSRHSAADCREIIKLARRVSKRREQSSKDGSPPRRWLHKEEANERAAVVRGQDLGYQSPERNLKDIFAEEIDSGNDGDRRKKLYVMYGGSWELVSRRSVKTLRREVLSAVPGVPKAALHQRWRSTTISFGALDCPDNMAGASVLLLITAPIVANMRLHHVLIDAGAGLNVISHAAFRQLQIPGSRLGPFRPFSRVGPQPVYPLGSIALLVTFGTEENIRRRMSSSTQRRSTSTLTPSSRDRLCTGSWPLPIMGTWSSRCHPPQDLSVRGDRTAALAAVEKLHVLVAETARPGGGGGSPSASGAKAPKVQPTEADGGPTKTIQVGADPSRTTHIAGNLGEK